MLMDIAPSVTMLGQKFVKPFVNLRVDAQTVSNTPAMKRSTQATE
jgi:hypothetical protein